MIPLFTRIVLVESPYSTPNHSRLECIRYACWACWDATHLHRECVFASHLFYTQFLNEQEERAIGLNSRDFIAKATQAAIIRYQDLGETSGMYRDVDCTAKCESRNLTGAALEGWKSGGWPPGSSRLGVVS